MASVLVAYATRQGTTAEVAEEVAATLRGRGLSAEVRPVADIASVGGYDAVVVGLPLYMGRPLATARRFVRLRAAELAGVPVAIFVLGPNDTEESRRSSRAQLDRWLEHHPELTPVSVALFGGAIVPSHLRFPFNRMAAGDWRDWDAIRAWAASLPLPASAPADGAGVPEPSVPEEVEAMIKRAASRQGVRDRLAFR